MPTASMAKVPPSSSAGWPSTEGGIGPVSPPSEPALPNASSTSTAFRALSASLSLAAAKRSDATKECTPSSQAPVARPCAVVSLAVGKPAAAVKPPAPVVKPLVASLNPGVNKSIESLLTEKRILLASFEAKFNEKILARHNDLMAEQKSALVSQLKKASATTKTAPKPKVDEGKDQSLALQVQKLKDDMDEQKFSHAVELSYLKKRAKNLEQQLKKEKEDKAAIVSAHANAKPVPNPNVNSLTAKVKILEYEMQQEKNVRIQQLKSLEMLHFAEFREIEKKHAEFVSHLVASYQKEIKVLKNEIKMEMEDQPQPQQKDNYEAAAQPQHEDNCEAAAAAAALSSLNAPSVAQQLTKRSSASDMHSNAVTVSLQVANPLSELDNEVTKNRTVYSLEDDTYSDDDVIFATTLKRDISQVSDSGSTGEYNEEPNKKRKAEETPKDQTEEILKGHKKKPRETHKDQIEEILKRAGKLPESNMMKKDGSDGRKKNLSNHAKEYLKAWMLSPEHCDHPYPSPEEKAEIIADTGITYRELNNWMVNNRKRFWNNVVKPKIPEIKQAQRMKEMKEEYKAAALDESDGEADGTLIEGAFAKNPLHPV